MKLRIEGAFAPLQTPYRLEPNIGLFDLTAKGQRFTFQYSFDSLKADHNRVLNLSPGFPHFGQYAYLLADEQEQGRNNVGEISPAQFALAMDGHAFLQQLMKLHLTQDGGKDFSDNNYQQLLDKEIDLTSIKSINETTRPLLHGRMEHLFGQTLNDDKRRDILELLNELKSGICIADEVFNDLCTKSKPISYIAMHEEKLLIAESFGLSPQLYINSLLPDGKFTCWGHLSTSIMAPLLEFPLERSEWSTRPTPVKKLHVPHPGKISDFITNLYQTAKALPPYEAVSEDIQDAFYRSHGSVDIIPIQFNRAEILAIYNVS